MSDLIIHRVIRDKNYKTINLTAITDKRLTLQARGLHAYLITKPDDWKTSFPAIVSALPHGKKFIRSALKELQEYGYLKITQERGANGRFITRWDISEMHDAKLK